MSNHNLDNIKLEFTIENSLSNRSQNLNAMNEVLTHVGVVLKIENNKLTIAIDEGKYNKIKVRNAGRKRVKITKEDGESYRYSDILNLLLEYDDKDICKLLKMNIATYYRHKKKMMESNYMRTIDSKRLTDRSYIETHENNDEF